MPEIDEYIIDLSAVEEPVEIESPQDDPLKLDFISGGIEYYNDWIEEKLSGVIDGENTVFTTLNNYKSGSTRVFINGLKQTQGTSYVESGNRIITFSEPPSANGFEDELIINYIKE